MKLALGSEEGPGPHMLGHLQPGFQQGSSGASCGFPWFSVTRVPCGLKDSQEAWRLASLMLEQEKSSDVIL